MESVFITGVSSGIGYGLAQHYLGRGWRVYGVSRRAPTDLIAQGLHFAPLDLRHDVEVARVIRRLLGAAFRLDLLILNAGIIGRVAPLAQQSLTELRDVQEVNVWANKVVLDTVFATCSAVIQVVAISSGAGVRGKRGLGGYCVSKAALNMLIQVYAEEHPPTHFTALSPGVIDTPMQDYLCSLPDDADNPTLSSLRSRRGTAAMPDIATGSTQLATMIGHLPAQVATGSYADLRDWLPST